MVLRFNVCKTQTARHGCDMLFVKYYLTTKKLQWYKTISKHIKQ